MRTLLPLLLALAPVGAAASTCYTLLDAAGATVYRGPTAPIDMSRPISDALRDTYPGHHLIFGHDLDCPAGSPPAYAGHTAAAGPGARASIDAILARYPDLGVTHHVGSPHLGSIPASAARSGARQTRAGTDVHVRAHTRADGTQVRAHTRAAPGTGAGR